MHLRIVRGYRDVWHRRMSRPAGGVEELQSATAEAINAANSLWVNSLYTNLVADAGNYVAANDSDDNENQGWTFAIPGGFAFTSVRVTMSTIRSDSQSMTVNVSVGGAMQTGQVVAATNAYETKNVDFAGSWLATDQVIVYVNPGAMANKTFLRINRMYVTLTE